MFKTIKKNENSPLFAIVCLISFLILVGVIMAGVYYFEAAEEARVEAFNSEELLIYNINETKYESSPLRYINDYIEANSIENISELEERFNEVDFSFIKEKYNESINYTYFNNDSMNAGDLELAVANSLNGETRHTSAAIKSFLEINRELLTPELEEKIYTSETEMITVREEAANIAQQEEWDREREERKIYQAMKGAFNDLTNFGDNYIPEVHDNLIAEAASELFGISIAEANRIYIAGEMGEY